MDLLKKLSLLLLFVTVTIKGQVAIPVAGSAATVSSGPYTVVNTLSELTSAGVNTNLEIRGDIVVTGDLSPASGQHWIITTGSIDLDVYSILTPVSITLPSRGFKGLDLFDSDQKINHSGVMIAITNEIMYASNLGAIDDNNPATDNLNVGRNMVHLANINSGHLVWDKKDTGIYWALPFPRDPFTNGQSPFFPFDNYTTGWVVGNGHDGVTIEHEGEVEIVSITNDLPVSRRYVFHNTRGSRITGGTLRGDRYRHRYNRLIEFTTAATTPGNITIAWDEVDAYVSFVTQQERTLTVALTASTVTQNALEVANYINTNLGADGYVASSDAGVVTIYKEGQDFEFRDLDGGTAGTQPFDFGSTGALATYTQDSYEWGHAIFWSSAANYCKIDNIHLTEFHGDGVASLYQGNGNTAIEDTAFSTGDIGNDGTIDIGETGFRYMTNTLAVPTVHEWFSFSPSNQTSARLKNAKYWVAFYDNTDTFLYKTEPLLPYARYYYRRGNDGQTLPKRFRIIVEYPGPTDWAAFTWHVQSESYMEGAIIDHVEISHTRRQGISNPPLLHFKLTNSKIHDVGGQEPQYAIDLEDYYQDARGWVIENCEFWNNANGDIIIKGASHGRIVNNFFQANSWPVRNHLSVANAITTSFGRQNVISGNHFEHKTVTLDIASVFTNNTLLYTEVNAKLGGTMVSDNLFLNSQVNDGYGAGSFGTDGGGGTSKNYVMNNVFKWSDNWGNDRLVDEANSITWINNHYVFNDRSIEYQQLVDPTYEEIYVTSNVFNYIDSSFRSTTNDGNHEGTIDGLRVEGLLVADTPRAYLGWTAFANDIKDFEIGSPLIIQDGYEKSFTVKDGFAWRLDFELQEFPSDGVGTYETIYVKDVTIRVPDQLTTTTGWLVNTGALGTVNGIASLIQVEADKNVNFVFENCTFDYGTNPAGQFMYLGHRGTTKFINCIFEADASQTVDFTASGARAAGVVTGTNTGAISIINPTKTNVTFTLRGGDSETAW